MNLILLDEMNWKTLEKCHHRMSKNNIATIAQLILFHGKRINLGSLCVNIAM